MSKISFRLGFIGAISIFDLHLLGDSTWISVAKPPLEEIFHVPFLTTNIELFTERLLEGEDERICCYEF